MSIKYLNQWIILLLLSLVSCDSKRPTSDAPVPLDDEEEAVFVEKGRLIAATTFAHQIKSYKKWKIKS